MLHACYNWFEKTFLKKDMRTSESEYKGCMDYLSIPKFCVSNVMRILIPLNHLAVCFLKVAPSVFVFHLLSLKNCVFLKLYELSFLPKIIPCEK